MKRSILSLVFVLAALGMVLFSCSKEDALSVKDTSESSLLKAGSLTQYFGTPAVVPFLAGQNTEAGTITVGNDADNVYVVFKTTGEWVMGQTHLYVGEKTLCPVNKNSSPKIGLFPYATAHDPKVQEYTYTISRKALPKTFIVAAHAEVYRIVNGAVVQTETAWGKGSQFVDKGSWAMYFDYTIQEGCSIKPVVFDYLGGQTILTGNLTVTNDDKNLYVTYNTNKNWYLNAVHLYVGTLGGMPVNNSSTPIPGKFPYNVPFSALQTTYTITIPLTGLPSCYIIAAHAELVQKIDGVVISTETGWSAGTQFPNTNRWGFYSAYCTQYCK
jgi:hypothetical protein